MLRALPHITTRVLNELMLCSVICVCAYISPNVSYAQTTPARYEIDAKRIGVTPYDKDALPRSREFIRLDSTYYVGYFLEGMFKYYRAADYAGYRNSIQALKKALSLYEKDFRSYLVHLTPGIVADIKLGDIIQLSNALYDSYSNVEQADSAICMLDKIHDWKLAYDLIDYHIKSAWTIHRNRYYLHKYSFLRNSVRENEDLALDHLYKAKKEGNPGANFYLALIYNYLQITDSTEYYYKYLMANGGISYNNYAHYKNTMGQFAEAINYFESEKFSFDKRLIESYYFLPTLYINSGNSLEGIRQTNEIISRNGSTPGFGWYNIALARSYLYNGQLDSAEKAISKAANFKELHIGTTLGQAQYDFSTNVVKLMLADQKIKRIKFFNKYWWLSFTDLFSISGLLGEQFLLRYAIVNEFVNNPERQDVVYTLFSSENVIGFDEIWNMIKDISPAYFTRLYKEKVTEEKRPNIRRYMQLFYGNFLYTDGKEQESKIVLEDLLYNTKLDTAHEKLFLARLAETLARCYHSSGDNDKYNSMLAFHFKEFPQLMPYSGIGIRVKMSISGIEDDVTKTVKKELQKCNIEWVSDNGSSLLNFFLDFNKNKDKYGVTFHVEDNNGQVLIPSGRLLFKSGKGIGKELALRLFGVSGPLVL